jgi:hypothetical protein
VVKDIELIQAHNSRILVPKSMQAVLLYTHPHRMMSHNNALLPGQKKMLETVQFISTWRGLQQQVADLSSISAYIRIPSRPAKRDLLLEKEQIVDMML